MVKGSYEFYIMEGLITVIVAPVILIVIVVGAPLALIGWLVNRAGYTHNRD